MSRNILPYLPYFKIPMHHFTSLYLAGKERYFILKEEEYLINIESFHFWLFRTLKKNIKAKVYFLIY